MSKVNEVVRDINTIISFIDDNNLYKGVDATPLTSAGVKISILKATLGEIVADLDYEYEKREGELKLREATLYLEYRDEQAKMSIDDARMKVRIDLGEETQELITLKGQVVKLKTFMKNVTDLVTNIQSRVSYLRHERNELQLNER